jgi:hypothetical protein
LESRNRAFHDLRQSAFVHARFQGFDGNSIRGFARMHEGATTVTATLITDDDRARLLAHGQARATGQALDPLPVVRLFTPDAHATWLLAALDPADGDTAHGLIDLGIGMPALGTVKLSDLASIVGPRRQPVMRDRYFQPVRRLSEYLRLAEENGSITD